MKKYFINHIIFSYQLIYLAIGTLCIGLTRFTITTPDTFNYLLIAEQLLQGKFYEAVSGHWSIGISILIAPLMALGVNGVLAFKIVNTIIGFFTLTLFLRIVDGILPPPSPPPKGDIRTRKKFRTAKNLPLWRIPPTHLPLWRGLGGGIALPFILSMTLELTPDLLLTTLLLWYATILIQSHLAFSKHKATQPNNKTTNCGLPLGAREQNYGWKCGLIAGLAYWAKAYTLPFFVVHFVGWHIILLLINYFLNKKEQKNNEGKKITGILKMPVISPAFLIRNLAVGCLIFILISTPYILALSTKLGQFSIGTSGTYNFALISPHRSHDQLTKNELINPETKFTDFWAYEEPALFVESWNPFASVGDVYYYTQFLASNVIRFCYFDYARHLIIFLIISILFIFYRKIKLRPDEWLFIGLMVFTAFVFTSGYFLVLVRERYFWLDNFIGLIVLFFIGKIFFRANAILPPVPSKFNKKIFTLIITLASALLIYDSIEMIQLQTSKQTFYKNLHQHLPELEALKGNRIATNDTWGAYHHTDAAVYLMYELRYQFWGQIRTQRLKREGLQEAKENEIDYFILWESPDLEQSIFENEDLIFHDTLPRIFVYKL